MSIRTRIQAIEMRRVIAASAAVTAIAGISLVHPLPASADVGACAVWGEDYKNDDGVMVSPCLVETGGASVGDAGGAAGGGSGSSGGDGSMSTAPIVVPRADRSVDPHCDTGVASLIEQKFTGESTTSLTGIPATLAPGGTVVHVSIDSNLYAAAPTTPWFQIVGLALGEWQQAFHAAGGGPFTFVLDGSTESQSRAESSMWTAVINGNLEYHWHIRAPYSPEDDPIAMADTTQQWSDGNGRTQFAVSRIFAKGMTGRTVDQMANTVAHELGHALGLGDMHSDDRMPGTIMHGTVGMGAPAPTCSDAAAAASAAYMDPATGHSPYVPPAGKK